MKRTILLFVFLATLLAVPASGLADDFSLTLSKESPARTRLQTRFYNGLTEKQILPLCVKAFERTGYKVTLVSDELALIRAWRKDELIKPQMATIQFFAAFSIDHLHTIGMLTARNTSNGVRVRAQFSNKIYESISAGIICERAQRPEEIYTQFFDTLDQTVAAAGRK